MCCRLLSLSVKLTLIFQTQILTVFFLAFMYPFHEKLIKKIALDMNFSHVSLSHEVMSMVRIVPRGHTASVDAYLTPAIQRYVKGFASGFSGNLKDTLVQFMVNN